MELRKIDEKNLWDIVNLAVHEHQKGFVATNTKSILQAYVTITAGNVALPFGIYHDNTPVGFVMFGYGNYDDDEPPISARNYCIWRFMIDKTHQGKGLGREAMRTALTFIRTLPCGEATHCWLAYEPENEVARALYRSMGFEENGEMCGDEIVAVLKL
jgi:diamine N-acetyltransferase